jgi:hypothetical protein
VHHHLIPIPPALLPLGPPRKIAYETPASRFNVAESRDVLGQRVGERGGPVDGGYGERSVEGPREVEGDVSGVSRDV